MPITRSGDDGFHITNLSGKVNSGYGLGLLQQTKTRGSSVTLIRAGGRGVNITGPYSDIELNGKSASLAVIRSGINITGTGTETGTAASMH